MQTQYDPVVVAVVFLVVGAVLCGVHLLLAFLSPRLNWFFPLAVSLVGSAILIVGGFSKSAAILGIFEMLIGYMAVLEIAHARSRKKFLR